MKIELNQTKKLKLISENDFLNEYGKSNYDYINLNFTKSQNKIFINPLVYYNINKNNLLGATLNDIGLETRFFLYDKKNQKKFYFETKNDKIILKRDINNISNIDINNNFYIDFEFVYLAFKRYNTGDFEVLDSEQIKLHRLRYSFSLLFENFCEEVYKYDYNKYQDLKENYEKSNIKNFEKTYIYEKIFELFKNDYFLSFDIKNQNNLLYY